MSESIIAPCIFIPHGAGPLPLLGDIDHASLVEFLKILPSTFPKPSAIIVISAHWEEDVVTITGNETPSIIYDYYGFAAEAYQIKYPAAGSANLANKVQHLLSQSGIKSKINTERGFDHGVYVPLKLMYPEADIPCIQLSLCRSLDPKLHINIGKAIKALRAENVLILGSGFSFHNMRAFFDGQKQDPRNSEFENWLIDTCTSDHTQYLEKEKNLIEWANAPSASYCHPREEHLLPLHVCFGARMANAKLIFDDVVIGKRTSAFQW